MPAKKKTVVPVAPMLESVYLCPACNKKIIREGTLRTLPSVCAKNQTRVLMKRIGPAPV
jgi:DNA-directed RNA polymerase subunit RPC12/RpoP